MKASRTGTIALLVTIGCVASAGCSATTDETEPLIHTSAPEPSHTEVAPPAPTTQPPTEMPTAPASTDAAPSEQQLAYESDIAAWPEPLPEGYRWPAWDELPHIGGDIQAQDNARGVYRCILIDAAWYAYFRHNDAEGSIEYAARADTYAIANDPNSGTVTSGGRIVDDELAAASGRCLAVVGDLQQNE